MITETLSAPGLTLELEERTDATMVHCSGTITAESAEIFQNEIRGRLVSDSRGTGAAVNGRIVLDLLNVTYVDSSGLAALLAVWTAGQRSSCGLELTNLSPRVERLVSMTKLDQLFNRTKTASRGAQNSVQNSEMFSKGGRVQSKIRPFQLVFNAFISACSI
jgi:anti-sigma B factor antagonist